MMQIFVFDAAEEGSNSHRECYNGSEHCWNCFRKFPHIEKAENQHWITSCFLGVCLDHSTQKSEGCVVRILNNIKHDYEQVQLLNP